MAREKEKKETELSRNRFHNTGQQRTLHAIETQVERERQKVIANNKKNTRANALWICREKNMIMQFDELKTIFTLISLISAILNA